jgi:hypothetical protein
MGRPLRIHRATGEPALAAAFGGPLNRPPDLARALLAAFSSQDDFRDLGASAGALASVQEASRVSP